MSRLQLHRPLNLGLLGVAALLAGLAVQSAVSVGIAQTPATGEKPAAESEDRRGPLPFYFGKLGLSDEQKDKLYTLQEDYDKKLEPLREQLKKLVAERDQKMEAALTPGQKLRLAELREEAKKRGESPDAPAAAPAAAPTSK